MTPDRESSTPPSPRRGPPRWVRRAKEKKGILLAALGTALTLGFVAWLFVYLRPDTWRYYTDEISFRHLRKDVDPRLVLWEPAAPVQGGINRPQDLFQAAVSPDGARMVFTRGLRDGNANLFMARWNGTSWDAAQPLHALNSPFNEVTPAFSRDGRILFFATDRPGGRGGYDIWASRWDGADFAWPMPLTVTVNSRFDDIGPEPSAMDEKLYFSSKRPREQPDKEDAQLPAQALREKYREADYDLYVAARIPPGATNRAVERAQSMLYSLREGALSEGRVLSLLGGSEGSGKAVERALAWLARSQETNGCWSIARHGGQDGHDVACTAFALLAFYGQSERHDRPGPYRAAVSNGVQWLCRNQNHMTGDLRGPRPQSNAMYDHCIAALALAEAYGLTKDENLYLNAQAAIDFLADSQNPDDGGWRYQPRQAGDLSVSGWAIMALKSAELSGLHVPKRTLEGVRRFLTSVAGGTNNGMYQYQPGGSHRSTAMVATGYFCSQLMGLSPNTLRAFETVNHLVGQKLTAGDVYYAYYGTLSGYQTQGPFWREWNRQLQKVFLTSQDPDGSWVLADSTSKSMGRSIVTSLITLCLQAHYRYTPLYGLGYEPDPAHGARSTLGEDQLPGVPEYHVAKLLEVVNSPADELGCAVTEHGDFLYFASNRKGGFGGFDIYRSRITGQDPTPPANVGRAINGPADERDPALRMAGFNLIFDSNRDAADPSLNRLHGSVSRQVFRRHVTGALPAAKWMLDRMGGRFILLGVLLAGFVASVIVAGRSQRPAAGSPATGEPEP